MRVRRQFHDLGHKIGFCERLERDLKPREVQPSIVNQQCVVYHFSFMWSVRCKLCGLHGPPPFLTRCWTKILGALLVCVTIKSSIYTRQFRAIVVLARNCHASTFDYIVMQMTKLNREKGHWETFSWSSRRNHPLNESHFDILRKCQGKFNCLLFEVLYFSNSLIIHAVKSQ